LYHKAEELLKMKDRRSKLIIIPLKGFGLEYHIIFLGTTVTNQNYIHDDIKNRLHPANACCHPVPNSVHSLQKPKD
jgi:hypothetical protein